MGCDLPPDVRPMIYSCDSEISNCTRPALSLLTKEQNMNILGFQLRGSQPMTAFIRDAAALIAVVSFVATIGVWSELLRAIV